MRAKLSSPNLSISIDCCGNDDGRGKGFRNKLFCSCGVQYTNLLLVGHGPATHLCGIIQTKPNTRSGHFPVRITPDIVVPHT